MTLYWVQFILIPLSLIEFIHPPVKFSSYITVNFKCVRLLTLEWINRKRGSENVSIQTSHFVSATCHISLYSQLTSQSRFLLEKITGLVNKFPSFTHPKCSCAQEPATGSSHEPEEPSSYPYTLRTQKLNKIVYAYHLSNASPISSSYSYKKFCTTFPKDLNYILNAFILLILEDASHHYVIIKSDTKWHYYA
jgi:hypothetical protein